MIRDVSIRYAIDTDDVSFLNTLDVLGARPEMKFSNKIFPMDYAKQQNKPGTTGWFDRKCSEMVGRVTDMPLRTTLFNLGQARSQLADLEVAGAKARCKNLEEGLDKMASLNL